MGLFKHEAANRAIDASGTPIQDAIRKIYPTGEVGCAPVYQDPDLTIMRAADMKSDDTGFFDLCYLRDGEYRVEIESPTGEILYIADSIIVGSDLRAQDLDEYETAQELTADLYLSYEERSGHHRVRPGQNILIRSTGIQYRVMQETESDPHLVTAGGVNFCETGTRYSNEIHFRQAVARGAPFPFPPGTVVFAGGSLFCFIDDGNTDLPGLTGWRRLVSPLNDADLAQTKAKTDLISVSQAVDLDALAGGVDLSGITAKTDLISVTQPIDLDALAAQGGPTEDTIFESIAALTLSQDSLSEGLTIRTRQEGYAYRVAASDASDHHVTFGPNKLYVLPLGGEYHFSAWGVDDTGTTDVQAEFEVALDLSMQNDMPLVLTGVEHKFDSGICNAVIPEGQTARLRSPKGTVVRTADASLKFRTQTTRLTENLAADVERYATQMQVSDTSNIKFGDLIFFKNEQARIDTNWNYPKNAIRRVQAVIDATTIELDQPMDMRFYAWEGNRNGRTITSITNANPGVVTATGFDLTEGDYIRLDFTGLADYEGSVFRVGPVSGTSFALHDEANSPVDTTGFASLTATDAEVYLQGQTAIEIYPQAKVDIDNINFLVGVEKIAISSIDVATGQITTAAAHGLTTGDIINMHDIGGTTELNDNDYEAVRVSDTEFTLRDFDDVAIDTTGMTAYTSGGQMRKSAGEYSSSIAFDSVSGRVTRCSFTGVIPSWLPGTVDTIRVNCADDLHLDHCHFERGRYCPLIQSGSRNIRVTNFTAKKIRHIDIAGWAQDVVVGPGVGNDTDSVIESHPCIRPVWTGIRDSVRHSVNGAINIRGVGEVVENCRSWATSGISVGTQTFTPVRHYEDWTASFTRRITNFVSPHGCISSSYNSPMIVERCDVPYISQGGSAPVYVDEFTTASALPGREVTTAFEQIVMDKRVDLAPTQSYAPKRHFVGATAITNTNPVGVTAPGHGLQTGEVLTFEDVSGMTEINEAGNREVTVIDADTFSWNRNSSAWGSAFGGVVIDSSGAVPNANITAITNANPGVVTAPSHGYTGTDRVQFSGILGMTELNTGQYRITVVDADTFQLEDLSHPETTDTTNFGTYALGYGFADSLPRAISGITRANPGVITTSAAHGFLDGDVIWLCNAGGMTELNEANYIVAGATSTTFELNDLTGANVDTTAYTAYTSGGTVSEDEAVTTVDLATDQRVGLGGTAMTRSTIYSEIAHSALQVDVPFLMRVFDPGQVPGKNYYGQVTLKAMTREGYAEAVYDLVMEGRDGGGPFNFLTLSGSKSVGGAEVRFKRIGIRHRGRIEEEAGTSAGAEESPEYNVRYGIAAVAEVSLASTSSHIISLDVEVDLRAG